MTIEPNIIGIDASITRTGIATALDTWSVKPADNGYRRHLWLSDVVAEVITLHATPARPTPEALDVVDWPLP